MVILIGAMLLSRKPTTNTTFIVLLHKNQQVISIFLFLLFLIFIEVISIVV